MVRRNDKPKVRIHIWVYEEDAQALRDLYGDTVGISKAVCTIISNTLKQIQKKVKELEDQ